MLLTLALLAVTAGITDYTAWMLHTLTTQQPAIQKSAFALLMLWILATALKVLRNSSASSPAATPEPLHADT